MQSVTFNTTSLQVVESTDHTFLLSSKDVANGYGISESVLRSHKNNQSDELIEGTHFIMTRTSNNASKTMWTKLGVVTLGFFIKSEQAKEFRKWASNYVIDGAEKHHKPHDNSGYLYQLRRENIELKRAINRISKDTTEKLSPDSAQFLLDLIGQISRWIDESERLEAIERNRREKTQRFLDVFVRTMNHPGITEQSMRKSDVI